MRILTLFLIFFLPFSCRQSDNYSSRPIDVQGHRGARGLMPENSIPAMLKAIEIGVSTLEMDVVINAENKVILSHEPFFSAAICYDSLGDQIEHLKEGDHNIYKMDLGEIRSYDCGTKQNPRFPDQAKIKVYKPLLSEVVKESRHFCDSLNRELPAFNIEIKSRLEWDGIYYASIEDYCDIVMNELKSLNIEEKTTIQSFDPRVLIYMHEKYPEMRLAYLLEIVSDWKEGLDVLGFKPEIISPYYPHLSKHIISEIHEENMQVIPWTVNRERDIRAILELGVDGIISDYPDRVLMILNRNGFKKE